MNLYIYKVIARFGLDSELDSMLFWKLTEAKKCAYLWLELEECDSVSIYREEADESGCFRKRGLALTIKREGE